MSLLRSATPSLLFGIAVASVVAICGCAREAGNRIILVTPRTAWAWPVYIAKEGGYYRKYGLDVELVFANHPAGVAMLTSGQADVNLLPLERAVEVGSLDRGFLAIGAPVGKWSFELIARADIPSVEALRGGRLGIGQYGDATDMFANSLLGIPGF